MAKQEDPAVILNQDAEDSTSNPSLRMDMRQPLPHVLINEQD